MFMCSVTAYSMRRSDGPFPSLLRPPRPGLQAAVVEDFQALRTRAEGLGLFQAQPLFFCLHLGHILLLELLAWMSVWLWGTGWRTTLLCSFILAVAQVTGRGLLCDL